MLFVRSGTVYFLVPWTLAFGERICSLQREDFRNQVLKIVSKMTESRRKSPAGIKSAFIVNKKWVNSCWCPGLTFQAQCYVSYFPHSCDKILDEEATLMESGLIVSYHQRGPSPPRWKAQWQKIEVDDCTAFGTRKQRANWKWCQATNPQGPQRFISLVRHHILAAPRFSKTAPVSGD